MFKSFVATVSAVALLGASFVGLAPAAQAAEYTVGGGTYEATKINTEYDDYEMTKTKGIFNQGECERAGEKFLIAEHPTKAYTGSVQLAYETCKLFVSQKPANTWFLGGWAGEASEDRWSPLTSPGLPEFSAKAYTKCGATATVEQNGADNLNQFPSFQQVTLAMDVCEDVNKGNLDYKGFAVTAREKLPSGKGSYTFSHYGVPKDSVARVMDKPAGEFGPVVGDDAAFCDTLMNVAAEDLEGASGFDYDQYCKSAFGDQGGAYALPFNMISYKETGALTNDWKPQPRCEAPLSAYLNAQLDAIGKKVSGCVPVSVETCSSAGGNWFWYPSPQGAPYCSLEPIPQGIPLKIESLASDEQGFESLTPSWSRYIGDNCEGRQFTASGDCELGTVELTDSVWDETLRFVYGSDAEAESIDAVYFKDSEGTKLSGALTLATGVNDPNPKVHVRVPSALELGSLEVTVKAGGLESPVGKVTMLRYMESCDAVTDWETASTKPGWTCEGRTGEFFGYEDFHVFTVNEQWDLRSSDWDRVTSLPHCDTQGVRALTTDGDTVRAVFNWCGDIKKSLSFMDSVEQFGLNSVTGEHNQLSSGSFAFYRLQGEGGQAFTDLDTSNLTDMSNIFRQAENFDTSLSSWDTSNATSMRSVFHEAGAFNQDLSGWDTSNVDDMSFMFYKASAFNQDLSSFDTSEVTDLGNMFQEASSFNQDISGWDTSKARMFNGMFQEASSFNQNLSDWDASSASMSGGLDYGASAWSGVNPITSSLWCNTGRPFFPGQPVLSPCTSAVLLTGPTEVEVGEEVTYTLDINSDHPFKGGKAYVTHKDGVVATYDVPDGSESFTKSVTMSVPDIEVSQLEDIVFPFQAFYETQDADSTNVRFESTVMVVIVNPQMDKCKVLRPEMLPATSTSFDLDADGTPNSQDADMDGDGTQNSQDEDIDGDGTPNKSDPTPQGPPSRPVPPNFMGEQELADLVQDHLYGENYPSTFPLPVDPNGDEEETFADDAGVLVPAPSYEMVVEVLNYTVDDSCGIDNNWDGNGGGSPELPTDPGIGENGGGSPEVPTDPGTGGNGGGTETPPGAYPILGDGGTTAQNPLGVSVRLIMPSEVYQGVESELMAQVDANDGIVEFGVKEVDLEGGQSDRILGSSAVDDDGYASIRAIPENYGDAIVYARYEGSKGIDTTAAVTTVNPAPFIDDLTLKVDGDLWTETPKGEVLPYGYSKVDYKTESGNAPQIKVEGGPCQVMSTRSVPPQITMLGTAIAPNRCKVTVSTGGYDAYAPKTWVYDVANAMGNQTTTLEADKGNGKVKVGGKKTLAKAGQSMTDEDYKFRGKKISWRVSSGKDFCSVTTSSSGKVSVKGLAKGVCTIEASAPKVKNKYKSFKQTYTYSVR